MATAAPVQATAAHNLSQSSQKESAGLTNDNTTSNTSSRFVPRGDITATLNYFSPPADGSRPFNYVETPPAGQPQRNFGDSNHVVHIHDIRGHEANYTLDHDAFLVVSGLPASAEKEFVDDTSIKLNYYPEVESLILSHVPGSTRVVIFDHTIRRSTPGAPRAPVTRVHIDQTAASAAQRVRQHIPSEVDALLKGRYRIINIWRPLNGPVEASPLGFASSASTLDADVIPVEHRYPDRTGQTAGIRHNEGQKWHYLSGMRDDERLFLECFDSESLKENSGVRGGRVPHTAFAHPGTRADARGRESIEVRALVFGP